ncbi:hypothetical protein [Streptomyces sp. NBC_01565]|uniref:hypothetical protein n=1 Tax=Streptomyces sp. NBC_01565 TaxID=2975881 RepID=UPI0022529CE7|nr:hypothetical protein [Streptomyces sp. NBC_01565]MCX4546927.1 hypothetical protein [Streptomyces sp. NBC_01565]
MGKRHDLTTYAYRKQRARLLAESDVCHLCGHPGAGRNRVAGGRPHGRSSPGVIEHIFWQ